MKRLISFFALIAIWASSALAHDFEVGGIYYKKNSDGNTVSVSYKGTSYDQYSNEYYGSVTIPPSVTYSGKTYDVTSIGSAAFYECSYLTSVEIPNSVTSIGGYAFAYCSGLTSVTIPNSVTSIGWAAFCNCSGLKSVTIGNSVTSIGEEAFWYCSGLTSVTIPNSVTSISESAFSGCSGLTSVTIPNSVTSIGLYAFRGCSGLTSIVVEQGNTKYDSRNDCNAIIATTSNTLILGCKNTIIPSSVTSIGGRAFDGCSGLKSITIPNSVTSIGFGAFSGCSGLTSVTIGNSVTSIGESAFYGCYNLKTVNWNAKNCSDFSGNSTPFYKLWNSSISSSYTLTGITTFNFGNEVEKIPAYLCCKLSGMTSATIPNSVTSIGEEAFQNCSGLNSVTIGNSVTSIGNSSFGGCNNIQELVWNAKNCASMGDMPKTNISSVTIGDGVEILPDNFVENSKITTVTIPNSVTTIGASAFSGCSGLPSVEIPNSTTSIGASAFADCRLIQHVTIGSNVNAIGDNAFKNCKYLVDVTNYSVIPQEINANVFDGVDLSLCYLYVLENSYDYYIREAVWKDFNVRISGVEGVEVDAATKEVEGYYDLNGIRLEEPIRGQVNIVRYTDGSTKKIVN